MSRRIELPMALETSGIAKGAKDGERALKDLEDAVADTSRGGARDLDKLEDELKDIQRQSEKTERSVDDIGDGGQKGFSRAGEAADEFKDEALANFSEITSSFDGSMESIGELAQGTLGGLAGSIPGIGIAAGVAAAGIGLATSAWENVKEATAEAKSEAWNYAFAVGESGEFAAAAAAVNAITSDVEKMAQANRIAQLTGWDVVKVVQALATGDGLGQLREDLDQSAKAAGNNAYEINGLVRMLGGLQEGFYEGADAAEVNRRALADYTRETGRATGQTDKLGNAIYEMPGGKQIIIDARTGEAYEDIEALERKKLRPKTVPIKGDTSGIDAQLAKYRNKTITVGKIRAGAIVAPDGRRLLQ